MRRVPAVNAPRTCDDSVRVCARLWVEHGSGFGLLRDVRDRLCHEIETKGRPGASKLMVGWKIEMRRGVQIVVSLLAIVLLARPFDCFANARTREAMDCCLKGKCVPSANADNCCKNTLPAASHFLTSKAAGHWTPLLSLGVPAVSAPLPLPAVHSSIDSRHRAPPPPNLTTLNRPLLI